VALHGNISAPALVTDLVQASKEAVSLLVCTKNFCLGVAVFCECRHKWRTFWPPWPTSPGPGPKPLDGSISLKVLLDSRLYSKSWYFGWPVGASGSKVM